VISRGPRHDARPRAQRHGKALEINAYPNRLDLDDVDARRARERGVFISINTDAHVLDHLDTMQLGVATARRGWIEKPPVINTWPAERLVAWLRNGGATRDQRLGRAGHRRGGVPGGHAQARTLV
jgi:hypothetical protein